MPIYLMSIRVLLSVELCVTLKTYLKGAPFYKAWGTQGTPAPDNVPAPRVGAVTWTDSTGNFWLFGGSGNDSAGAGGWLNELWKYSGGEWTWMSGSNLVYQAGT